MRQGKKDNSINLMKVYFKYKPETFKCIKYLMHRLEIMSIVINIIIYILHRSELKQSVMSAHYRCIYDIRSKKHKFSGKYLLRMEYNLLKGGSSFDTVKRPKFGNGT